MADGVTSQEVSVEDLKPNGNISIAYLRDEVANMQKVLVRLRKYLGDATPSSTANTSQKTIHERK